MLKLLQASALFVSGFAAVFSTAATAQAALPEYLARMDRDKDGKISAEDWVQNRPALFKNMDKDSDGFVTKDEATAYYISITSPNDPRTEVRVKSVTDADANTDGKVSAEEIRAFGLSEFKKRDKDADGFITGMDTQK